jgi:hypothetical protein
MVHYHLPAPATMAVTGRYLAHNRLSRIARAFVAAELHAGAKQLVKPTLTAGRASCARQRHLCLVGPQAHGRARRDRGRPDSACAGSARFEAERQHAADGDHRPNS